LDFGSKLKTWLTEKHGALITASEVYGVSQVDLSRYVNNKVRPGFDFLKKITLDGAPITWLLSEDEDMVASSSEDVREVIAKLEIENKELKEKIAATEGVLKKAESAMRLKNDLLKFMNKKED